MSLLLSAHQLGKQFASRPLFDGLTFSILEGDRIGLIGANGAGKSTLLKILAGQDRPDSGSLTLRKGVRVAYLPQVPMLDPNHTILEAVVGRRSWDEAALARESISRLELDRLPEGVETKVGALSGGWSKRVALAHELAQEPELLLLDEPTNHLDVESILWLEDFLARQRFATVTVTHDKAFLQKVSKRIFEVDRRNPGGILVVDGSYADFVEKKQERIQNLQSREASLQNRLRRETEWLRQGAKARTTKQQARIQRAGELSKEVAHLSDLNRESSAKLDFQDAGRGPKKLIEAKEVGHSKGGKNLFTNWSAILRPGMRLGLLGPNGCGKSTLIRVLLGEEDSDQGEVWRSDSLQVAYFEQTRDRLDPDKSLLKTICPYGEFVDFQGSRIHVRSWLDRFLFRPEQAEMAVGKLSGGEQSRLLLSLLMLEPANCLVLDEPTNDLDLATLDLLEDCLTDFPGLVILVSHDRYFLDQVSTHLIAFEPEARLTPYADLEQWQNAYVSRMKAAQIAAKNAAAGGGASAASGQKKRRLSYNEQREWDTMEKRVQECETRIGELAKAAQDPKIASNFSKLKEAGDALEKSQGELEKLYTRWAELEALGKA